MSDRGFFSRWAQRKQEQRLAEQTGPQDTEETLQPDDTTAAPPVPEASEQPPAASSAQTASAETAADANTAPTSDTPLTDADMPDLTEIDGNSNVSAFFSEGVSQALRKKALKAMFLQPEFNLRDGMDDYDLDYTNAKELTAEVSASLRQWLKESVEESRAQQPEQEQEQEKSTDTDNTGAAAVNGQNDTPADDGQESPSTPAEPHGAHGEKTDTDQENTGTASSTPPLADSDSTKPTSE